MKQYIQNSWISIVMITILCGCGFKGPLYLPKKAAASATKSNASAAKLNASTTQ